jgi:hypothetical protein
MAKDLNLTQSYYGFRIKAFTIVPNFFTIVTIFF